MTDDAEIEDQHREAMNRTARALDDAFNPGGEQVNGFFLAVFSFEAEGRFNYISNADRRDIIVLLKEMLARFEGQPEIKGRA